MIPSGVLRLLVCRRDADLIRSVRARDEVAALGGGEVSITYRGTVTVKIRFLKSLIGTYVTSFHRFLYEPITRTSLKMPDPSTNTFTTVRSIIG